MKKRLEQLNLREAMHVGESLAKFVLDSLRVGEEIEGLGLEVLSLSVLAIRPGQETARARRRKPANRF